MPGDYLRTDPTAWLKQILTTAYPPQSRKGTGRPRRAGNVTKVGLFLAQRISNLNHSCSVAMGHLHDCSKLSGHVV